MIAIYCLGFIYSFPRFFEYKTEVQQEKLSLSENFTEYYDHLVITNKVLDNRVYHYIVHLGMNIYFLKWKKRLFDLFSFFFKFCIVFFKVYYHY